MVELGLAGITIISTLFMLFECIRHKRFKILLVYFVTLCLCGGVLVVYNVVNTKLVERKAFSTCNDTTLNQTHYGTAYQVGESKTIQFVDTFYIESVKVCTSVQFSMDFLQYAKSATQLKKNVINIEVPTGTASILENQSSVYIQNGVIEVDVDFIILVIDKDSEPTKTHIRGKYSFSNSDFTLLEKRMV